MPPTPIVIVTGPPASGKTTVARAVAGGTGLPLLATYPLLYHFAALELSAGRPFVLEANFAAAEATVELRRLHERRSFRALRLVCTAEPEVLEQRYVARAASRHPGHGDLARLDEVRDVIARGGGALDLPGEVVEVDTTDADEVDLDALVDRARARVAT